MTRRMVGTVLAATSLLALGACGVRSPLGDGEGAEVRGWVADACAAVQEVRTVAERPQRITVEDVTGPEGPRGIIDLLESVRAETADARSDVLALGAPPVEGASDARDEIIAEFDDRLETLEESRRFVIEASDRRDPVAPSQIVGAGQSAYRTAPALGRAIERIPDLRDAFREAPECDGL